MLAVSEYQILLLFVGWFMTDSIVLGLIVLAPAVAKQPKQKVSKVSLLLLRYTRVSQLMPVLNTSRYEHFCLLVFRI